VSKEQNYLITHPSQRLPPLLATLYTVQNRQRMRVVESGYGFFKPNAVLPEVGCGLRRIPLIESLVTLVL
jgi:hypothetical protein